MKTEQVLGRKVQRVAALPGGGWAVPGEKEATVTVCEPGQKQRTVAVGGSKLKYGVVALHGMNGHSLVVSDGIAVVFGELGGTRTLRRAGEWTLPGELGWHAFVDSTADGQVIIAASDKRLARFGSMQNVVSEAGDFTKHFRAVALLPGAKQFVVGRGDGNVELRDSVTLEVIKRWAVGKDAVLALCVLNEKTIAVATDDARTQLLEVETGALTELPLARMKTSGLHRHADGRLIVVGLSRRVSIFDGATRVREADLWGSLGDRYIQDSALDGDTLLLACEERGLLSVRLSDFPESVAPVELSRPAEQIRADAQKLLDFELFNDALKSKADLTESIRRVLRHDDDGLRHGVFLSLARKKIALRTISEHLRSPMPRVRYFAADHYGQFPAELAAHFEELKPVLADADPSVAAAAAWALGRIGNPVAVEWLLPLVRHAAQPVRATSALALLALHAGQNEIVNAISGGAGELTFTLLSQFWPQLNTSLLLPLRPELIQRAQTGFTIDEVLRACDVEVAPDFVPTGVDGPLTATLREGAVAIELLHQLALVRRWACTFADDRLRLTGPATAAEWWKGELERRFPRS